MRFIIPDHQHREGDEDSEKDVDPGDNEYMYAYVSQGHLPEKDVYPVRGNVARNNSVINSSDHDSRK
jgi:hypothetical protein